MNDHSDASPTTTLDYPTNTTSKYRIIVDRYNINTGNMEKVEVDDRGNVLGYPPPGLLGVQIDRIPGVQLGETFIRRDTVPDVEGVEKPRTRLEQLLDKVTRKLGFNR